MLMDLLWISYWEGSHLRIRRRNHLSNQSKENVVHLLKNNLLKIQVARHLVSIRILLILLELKKKLLNKIV